MSTRHVIQIGYNSSKCKYYVWEELKNHAEYLCNHPDDIAIEAKKYTVAALNDLVDEFSKAYTDCRDLTIQIKENKDVDKCYISQSSSGGGDQREVKEQLRRAFCRLILDYMHFLNMEINISVG